LREARYDLAVAPLIGVGNDLGMGVAETKVTRAERAASCRERILKSKNVVVLKNI